jgi:hypothetical protein
LEIQFPVLFMELDKKFINFRCSRLYLSKQAGFSKVAEYRSYWILDFVGTGLENKLIDIGLRWHSLDIEQSYWTVISGHWMVL